MKFGTDGLRGPAGVAPIDPETAVRIGRAAARLARANGSAEVVVGRDTRPSGPMLAAACCAGIAAEGCVARDAGVVPTAAVAVGIADTPAGAGVVITASHNPWTDNGFKVLSEGGRKPLPAEVEQLESWLSGEERTAGCGLIQQAPEVLDLWRGRLTSGIDLGALQGRRIALDLAQGAATVARDWLDTLGMELVHVHGDRINDGVGSEAPGRLQHTVVEQRCWAGIAVDGDADRVVLVDEKGEIVPGDALTWWLARAMQVEHLAVTVMSTAALGPSLPGVQLTVTDVGDKHLQAAMAAAPIPLAAEESGHVLFADHPGGDGLLAGLRALASVRSSVSESFGAFVPWPRVKSKVRVSARPPLESLTEVQRVREEGEERLGEGGRVFLRYSGTEPVLRILVEGRDAAVVSAVAARVEAAIRREA